MKLSGKKAIVTGASRGIGAAICSQLLAEKVFVTGLSRTPPQNKQSERLFAFQSIDFSNLDKLSPELKKIHQHSGTPDILICNAGYGRFGSLEEFSSEQIRTLIDVNLTSQIMVVREFIAAMKTLPEGHIVIMGSEAALSGGIKGSVYSATKFALRGFSQSIRKECSSSNIAVTLINPGMVDTEFFDDLNFSPGAENDQHLLPSDIAKTVVEGLNSRAGCCIEEINLSPQKKVILKK